MEPIRIGVVEDDPTASRLVLTYLVFRCLVWVGLVIW